MGNKIDKNKLLNKSIHIRFTNDYFDYIQRISRENYLKPSIFIREILMKHAPQYDQSNKAGF